MFDGTAGKYYATSSVGADIWDMLETPISVSKIVIWLVEMYDVDGTVCLEEVLKFLRELDCAGLLSRLSKDADLDKYSRLICCRITPQRFCKRMLSAYI